MDFGELLPIDQETEVDTDNLILLRGEGGNLDSHKPFTEAEKRLAKECAAKRNAVYDGTLNQPNKLLYNWERHWRLVREDNGSEEGVPLRKRRNGEKISFPPDGSKSLHLRELGKHLDDIEGSLLLENSVGSLVREVARQSSKRERPARRIRKHRETLRSVISTHNNHARAGRWLEDTRLAGVRKVRSDEARQRAGATVVVDTAPPPSHVKWWKEPRADVA